MIFRSGRAHWAARCLLENSHILLKSKSFAGAQKQGDSKSLFLIRKESVCLKGDHHDFFPRFFVKIGRMNSSVFCSSSNELTSPSIQALRRRFKTAAIQLPGG